MTPQEKMEKAKQRILLNHRFFAVQMMRYKWVEEPRIPTFRTDGKTIWWNPDFLEPLTLPEVIGCLIHEFHHKIFKHPYRRNGRDKEEWNEACDYAINYLVKRFGFELPEGTLINPEFEGMSAEEIYNVRRQKKQEEQKQEENQKQESCTDDSNEEVNSSDEQKNEKTEQNNEGSEQQNKGPEQQGDSEQQNDGGYSKQQSGSDQSKQKRDTRGQALDEVVDVTDEEGHDLSESEKAYEEQQIDREIVQAEQFAKKAGQEFAGVDRLVKNAIKVSTPWQQVLERFMYESARTMYDWCRFSRRESDFINPVLHNYEVGNIIMVIDTSGSINERIFNQFTSELKVILSNIASKLFVIFADNKVQGEAIEITINDLDTLKPKGYGGTDFKPAFDYVQKKDMNPTVLIYLTDFECHSFPKDPDYPVLWAVYGRLAKQAVVPFGEKIELI